MTEFSIDASAQCVLTTHSGLRRRNASDVNGGIKVSARRKTGFRMGACSGKDVLEVTFQARWAS
jgi:hypothetical protein